jgi:hypothetical protein
MSSSSWAIANGYTSYGFMNLGENPFDISRKYRQDAMNNALAQPQIAASQQQELFQQQQIAASQYEIQAKQQQQDAINKAIADGDMASAAALSVDLKTAAALRTQLEQDKVARTFTPIYYLLKQGETDAAMEYMQEIYASADDPEDREAFAKLMVEIVQNPSLALARVRSVILIGASNIHEQFIESD